MWGIPTCQDSSMTKSANKEIFAKLIVVILKNKFLKNKKLKKNFKSGFKPPVYRVESWPQSTYFKTFDGIKSHVICVPLCLQ